MAEDQLLTLSNVTRYDNDVYLCVADNGVGSKAISRTKLTVECEPSFNTHARAHRSAISMSIAMAYDQALVANRSPDTQYTFSLFALLTCHHLIFMIFIHLTAIKLNSIQKILKHDRNTLQIVFKECFNCLDLS